MATSNGGLTVKTNKNDTKFPLENLQFSFCYSESSDIRYINIYVI